MMKTAKATLGEPGFSWILPVTAGFLVGFLLVYGWQSGAIWNELPHQASDRGASTSVSGQLQPNRETGRTGPGFAFPQLSPLEAAGELAFQSDHVEKKLKGPTGRLEKLLQQCELKAAKSQQAGEPSGDTTVRIEVPPFSVADVEAFWRLAEQELQQLEPGLQPYFIARVQNLQALFLSHPQESGVLFVKQLETKVPGEPSVQYWFFQTSDPSAFVLRQDGSIDLPVQMPLPQATAWFDPGTFKQPPRLKHLATFKYN